MNSKHIVVYTGNGVWKDNCGEMWGTQSSSGSNSNIKSNREYSNEMTTEQFLESRPDIAFMSKYGSMTVSSIIVDGEKPQQVEAVKPVEETKSNAPNKKAIKITTAK